MFPQTPVQKELRKRSAAAAAAAALGQWQGNLSLLPLPTSTVNKPRAKGLIRLLKQPVNFI